MGARRGVKSTVRVQYGALPYRFTSNAALEILVVTTRQTRSWIVPKGWPIRRLSPAKSAAREAWEEAGVRGRIGPKPIGAFFYDKALDETGASVTCEVKIFPLLVERHSETWPEVDQRVVQWVDPQRAMALVKEPGLKALIGVFAKRAAAAATKAIC